jgi:uncharacterized membrane protein
VAPARCHDPGVSLFETFMGLPLHPLAVHLPVIFIPLLVLATLAYVFLPGYRGRFAWAAVALAVIAPLSALGAKLSGDAFRARLANKGASHNLLSQIDTHRTSGTITLYVVVALGLVVLALILMRTPPRAVSLVLSVLAIGLAVASAYYVYHTGDLGARIAWGSS